MQWYGFHKEPRNGTGGWGLLHRCWVLGWVLGGWCEPEPVRVHVSCRRKGRGHDWGLRLLLDALCGGQVHAAAWGLAGARCPTAGTQAACPLAAACVQTPRVAASSG